MEFNSYTSIDLFISGVLALIMFGIGLSLTFSSFRNLFFAPKSLIIGLAAQMIFLPLLAFGTVFFADIPLHFKVGFIILASCPGGTTSGFITYFFKGNVALSISLITVNSLITLFSIPFIVNLGLWVFLGKTSAFHLPYLESLIQIFAIAVIPVMAGILVRKGYEDFALGIQKPLKTVLIILLALVFIIKLFANENQGGTGISSDEIAIILPYSLLINVLAFVIGFFTGKFSKLDTRNSYTIGVEVTMQNTTLAFLVAGTLLQNQDMVKPSLIYSMFSFWTAIIFTYVLKKTFKTKLMEDFKDE